MEIVKAEPLQSFDDNESIYHFKIELIEINKIMIEIFNSRTGIKYRTYLNSSDKWWDDNSSKFQNDFSKVYEIINNCISKTKEYLNHEIQEKNDILSLKIIYMNDLFPFDTLIKIQRMISKNGLTDEKINVLEYQLNKIRDMISSENIIYSKKNSIPDGDNIEINNEVNNIIFKGSFKNNKRNGFGTEYDPNTGEEIFKGNYKDGYCDGSGESYNKSILTRKSEYKKGIFHGKSISYCIYPGDTTNKVKISCEEHYQDGLHHGENICYKFCNRTQKHYISVKTNYVNGSQNGKVSNYQIFPGDKSNEVKIFAESYYRNGYKHGEDIGYQFCTKTQKHFISVKTNYINDSQNGLHTNFMISPKTSEYRKNNECNMKNGLHHGEYISYGDGEVVSTKQNYNMGVQIYI